MSHKGYGKPSKKKREEKLHARLEIGIQQAKDGKTVDRGDYSTPDQTETTPSPPVKKPRKPRAKKVKPTTATPGTDGDKPLTWNVSSGDSVDTSEGN